MTTRFGQAMKRQRKGQGWSQRALAARLGVHFTSISKIEAGAYEAGEPLIRAAAGLLGADAETWLELAGKIDTAALRVLAQENPDAARLLRRLPTADPARIRAAAQALAERKRPS